MTSKDLKRLSRKDLLEILVEYAQQMDNLESKIAENHETINRLQTIIDGNAVLAEQLEDLRSENEDLISENEELRSKLSESEKKLRSQQITIKNSGSIAEAALKLNQVFDAAQKAADQYLNNVRQMSSISKPSELEYSRQPNDLHLSKAEKRRRELELKYSGRKIG